MKQITVVDLPSRNEVLEVLTALCDGRVTPEAADEWAWAWLKIDETPGQELRITDWGVWNALTALYGADTQIESGVYLHGRDDYISWLEVLRNAPVTNPSDKQD